MELIVCRWSQKKRQQGRACHYVWKEGRNVDSKVGQKKKSLNLSKGSQPSNLEKNDNFFFFFFFIQLEFMAFIRVCHIPVNTQAEVQNLLDPLSFHLVPMRYGQLKLCLLAHCRV